MVAFLSRIIADLQESGGLFSNDMPAWERLQLKPTALVGSYHEALPRKDRERTQKMAVVVEGRRYLHICVYTDIKCKDKFTCKHTCKYKQKPKHGRECVYMYLHIHICIYINK